MSSHFKTLMLGIVMLAGAKLPLHAQGTAFTYQGRLNNNGSLASGSYDVQFMLYGTNVAGIAIAGPVTNLAVAVSNGLFTTTLDFGTGVFTGMNCWLDLAVRTNGAVAFTELTPRQALTPTPYAIFANAASNLLGSVAAVQLTGTLPAMQLPGTVVTNLETGVTLGGAFAGDGSELTNLNASQLTTGTVPTSVLAGFQAPNYAVVAGGQNNTANNTCAVVGGGKNNTAQAGYALVSGGGNNTASNAFAAVGGGFNNSAGGYAAVVPGGYNNTASGQYSFAAGQNAQASHPGSFVWADSQSGGFASTGNDTFNVRAQGGVNFQTGTNGLLVNGQPLLVNWANYSAGAVAIGSANDFVAGGSTGAFVTGISNSIPVTAPFSAISGGADNSIFYPAQAANIGGGFSNSVAGAESVIAGGQQNSIGSGSGNGFIGGGQGNNLLGGGGGVQFAGIACGVGNVIRWGAGASFIGGGQSNTVAGLADWAVISGGQNNLVNASADWGAIGGGIGNVIGGSAAAAVISGGENNAIGDNNVAGFIGGGNINGVYGNATNATIGGGYDNEITGANATFIGGGQNNLVQSNSPNSVIVGGQQNKINYNSGYCFVGGGLTNYVDQNAAESAIVGGQQNTISYGSGYSFVGAGQGNFVSQFAPEACIVGGSHNAIYYGVPNAFIGGGINNQINSGNHGSDSDSAVIVGGSGNVAQGSWAAVGGGMTNVASATGATVAGGGFNTANGNCSFAVGCSNSATGDYSAALGDQANATNNGAFVWSDGTAFSSTAANQFLIHAAGGVGIGVNNPGVPLDVNGRLQSRGSGNGTSAGLWLYDTDSATQRAFFGMDKAGYVGFWGNAGSPNWGLIMNVTNSYVGIGGVTPDAMLTVNGSADKPGGGSWSTYSDARLKDVGASFTDGLAALQQLQPVHYHYKSDNPLKLPSQPEYVGVVAQQVQTAIPEAVQKNPAGYLTVNNDPVIWTMVNAIKELNRKVEQKEAENTELKQQLADLKTLVQQLAQERK